MTENIDHVAAAVGYLHPDSYQPEKAQVHATLALAEQQRIANLIAYDRSRIHFGGYRGMDAVANPELHIREAVGLS